MVAGPINQWARGASARPRVGSNQEGINRTSRFLNSLEDYVERKEYLLDRIKKGFEACGIPDHAHGGITRWVIK